MQVIGLPGRHAETEPWLRSVLLAAKLPAEDIARYRHWEAGVEASVSFEARRLEGLVPSLVVAKSFGTRIAAAAFVGHRFRPQAAVLIGTPYLAIEADDLALLRHLANGVPTLFIQQVEDPGGSSAKLASSLQLLRAEVVAVPGSDHLYSDTAELATIISRWSTSRFQ
jgi:predicted alpha/beta-hydrolase family hydrolase